MKTNAEQAENWLKLATEARPGQSAEAIGFAMVHATLAVADELRQAREAGQP